jgi:predicted nucleotidyltransferase component of viral defense system
MELKIIYDKLKTYTLRTKQEEKNALREIAHAIALSGLARTDFFEHACFIGGSCLRMVYGLTRFSEDLDFWTLQTSPEFCWQHYLQAVQEEFAAFGFDMVIEDRANADRKIKKAFLKKDSIGKVLILSYARKFEDNEKLSIKFEIDTSPPKGAVFESKNMDFPYAFSITTLDRPSLFASKVAALFDEEKNKAKGRHWYDFMWYVFNKWPINYDLLGACLAKEMRFSILQEEIAILIRSKTSKNWEDLKKDVRAFISQEE